MNITDIREMENQAILDEVDNLEKEIMKLRMGNSIGTVENPLEIRGKRRNVARLKTVLRERELKIR